MNQDCDCFLRVSRFCGFDYLDEPLTIRRMHATNQSRDYLRVWKEAILFYHHYADWYPGGVVDRKSILDAYAECLSTCLYRRDFTTALRVLSRTRNYDARLISVIRVAVYEILRNKFG